MSNMSVYDCLRIVWRSIEVYLRVDGRGKALFLESNHLFVGNTDFSSVVHVMRLLFSCFGFVYLGLVLAL